MSNAILNAKPTRNITLEICVWGYGSVEEWGADLGHYWRTGGDAWDGWLSVLYNLDRNDETRYVPHNGASAGAWNYPDALFTGKGGMTETEYRSSFALWCAIKSPLFLGSDLRNMETSDVAYGIIANRELIAINQDSLGVQATCTRSCCGKTFMGALLPKTCPYFRNSWQVWTGPLNGDSYVVVVLNRYDVTVETELNWTRDALIPPGTYIVRDLWTHTDLDVIQVQESGLSLWHVILEAHGNLAYKLIPTEPIEANGVDSLNVLMMFQLVMSLYVLLCMQ